jgi:hypothetical protein
VTFVVTALYPHAVTLHRVDTGGAAECFVLLAPGVEPAPDAVGGALPRAAGMPMLFHRDGGFWHVDPATGQQTALGPATPLERLARFTGRVRFTAEPRPEDATGQRRAGERRRAAARLAAS